MKCIRGIQLILFIASSAAGTASAAAASTQQRALPRVIVITTGGTIASRTDADMMTGEALLQAVPEIGDVATVRVIQFSNIGSSLMTPVEWLALAKLINTLFSEDPDISGVVVTHGTDSLEETAFFLHLTVRDRRPVVVVGSMRPANAVSADGPANLLNGVRVAATAAARNKGVLVVLNDEINAARDVIKTDANRLHTFQSVQFGILGLADPDTVVFYRAPLRPHTADSDFDIMSLDELPRVAIVADYAGSDGFAVRAAATIEDMAGLVVTAFPSGLLSVGSSREVIRVAARGIPVVVHSRSLSGRTQEHYVEGAVRRGGSSAEYPAKAGVVIGREFSAVKARILLMLALTKTSDAEVIQRYFNTY